MKRSLLICLILLACSLVFAACDQDDIIPLDTTTASPETTAPETTAPETTAPETTAPETTVEETTVEETTVEETTVEETTVEETTVEETTVEETTVEETTNNAVGIKFNTLTMSDNKVYGNVSNDTEYFSFFEEVTVVGDAKYIISYDVSGINTIPTKTIPLNTGDNTLYITVFIDDAVTAFYSVTIRRNPIHTVSFNTNGGLTVPPQYIEEGYYATQPITTRTGYTFVSWDYDFSTPITSDRTVNANWIANTDTPYTVEYYLENVDKNGYDLIETQNLTGTTDTTAIAEQKTFEHFTINAYASTLQGSINSDGSLVLRVYYSRNMYTVSTQNGTISGAGTYIYDNNYVVELTANEPPLGYVFVGWYSENELLSSETKFTSVVDRDIVARFDVVTEMQNFIFTSSLTSCSITGIKDETVTEIIVPDYVTSISYFAFGDCKNLENITLPFVGAAKDETTYTHFGYIFGAISYQDNNDYVPSSLKSVVITCTTEIGSAAFSRCLNLISIKIPDSVTNIGSSAFSNCRSLTNINIPAGITSINASTFSGCTSLLTVEIPYGVTNIDFSAFYDCENLTSIEIPDSVTRIGGSAFRYCFKLANITIPKKVKSIGNYTFQGCSNLTSIVIPDGVTSIGDYVFYSCSNLTNIEIPDSVTSIGDYAFYRCFSLANITIPNKVSSIGNYTFQGCSNLTSIVIPDGVTSIGDYVFYSCTNLTNIEIPDSVTSIGKYAFSGCLRLTNIWYRGSQTQWNAISKNSYLDSDTGNYTITFNYTGE